MVAHKVIFSIDSLKNYEQHLFKTFKAQINNEDVYETSIQFGKAVSEIIIKRAMADNYLKSRSKPKYLGSIEPGKMAANRAGLF